MTKSTKEVTCFSVGDRVRERANLKEAFGRGLLAVDPKSGEKIYYRNARVGEIKEIVEKKNRSGSRIQYLNILWDGFKTPSTHMRNRVTLIETR